MTQNKVVELTDKDIEDKKAKLKNSENAVENQNFSIKELEERLDKKIDQRFAERQLQKAKENLSQKKIVNAVFQGDIPGQDLDELDQESLELKIKSQEEYVKSEMPLKNLRNQIAQLKQKTKHEEQWVIAPLKKQIRERKIVAMQ